MGEISLGIAALKLVGYGLATMGPGIGIGIACYGCCVGSAIDGAGLLSAAPSIGWIAFLLAMYALEVLVAFLQAYVFTILTAVYVSLATSSH